MKSGARIGRNGFTLVYKTGTAAVSRFSFIVSTKVDKKAVTRNRVRRLLRQSVGAIVAAIPHPIDGVLIANKRLVGLSQSAVNDDIWETFGMLLPKKAT